MSAIARDCFKQFFPVFESFLLKILNTCKNCSNSSPLKHPMTNKEIFANSQVHSKTFWKVLDGKFEKVT